MPSGYEKSPDYGGLEPRPWLWLAGGVLLATGLAYWLFA